MQIRGVIKNLLDLKISHIFANYWCLGSNYSAVKHICSCLKAPFILLLFVDFSGRKFLLLNSKVLDGHFSSSKVPPKKQQICKFFGPNISKSMQWMVKYSMSGKPNSEKTPSNNMAANTTKF